MKSIIISDIRTKEESIIPYGLQFSKFLESEVEILHLIDPRLQHGVYSSYADSQSISPGDKMGNQEVIQREKNTAETALHKLIGKEASRLNYPLKIKTTVEARKVEEAIQEKAQEDSNLVIFSTEPDYYIFDSQAEILDAMTRIRSMVLLVPPGLEFKPVANVIFPTDFLYTDSDYYAKILNFLSNFNPVINAVDVTGEKHFLDLEMKGKGWINMIRSLYDHLKFTSTVLKGKHYSDTVVSYVKRNDPDLVLMSTEKKQTSIQSKVVLDFMRSVNIPILYF